MIHSVELIFFSWVANNPKRVHAVKPCFSYNYFFEFSVYCKIVEKKEIFSNNKSHGSDNILKVLSQKDVCKHHLFLTKKLVRAVSFEAKIT
jgi:hypothetical protein